LAVPPGNGGRAKIWNKERTAEKIFVLLGGKTFTPKTKKKKKKVHARGSGQKTAAETALKLGKKRGKVFKRLKKRETPRRSRRP